MRFPRPVLLLGLLVGLSVLIPYVGAVAVTVPVAVIAYFQWGFTSDYAWLIGAYFVIQALDGNVLVPLLFSEVVNLHPVAIIVAILVYSRRVEVGYADFDRAMHGSRRFGIVTMCIGGGQGFASLFEVPQ